MATPAPHANTPQVSRQAQFGPYAADVDDGSAAAPPDFQPEYQPQEFAPGERIGRPLVSARRKFAVRTIVVGTLAASGSWAWLNHQATLTDWASVASAAISPLLDGKPSGPVAQNLSPAPQQPTAVKDSTPPTGSPAMPPSTAAALAPAAPDMDAAASPPEKLPPPVVDAADPFQKRALAVGLHPDLSRVLLAKLSAADYRNAGIAIKTALAETRDTDIFVWPRQRTAELALFQVKFVAGAPSDCRRYVVMVTKDGWLTTALPMETCGVRMKQAGGSSAFGKGPGAVR